jgi:hypothetical protein
MALVDCLASFMPAAAPLHGACSSASAALLFDVRCTPYGGAPPPQQQPEPEPEPQEVWRQPGVPMEMEGVAGAEPTPERELGSPVFVCVSPPPVTAPKNEKRQRVSFGATNCVRIIGAPAAADSEAYIKEHDGPDHSSVMMDALLHAFFEKGGNQSLEALQFVLGASLCRDIGASAAELSGRCCQLSGRRGSAGSGSRCCCQCRCL